MFWRFVLVLFLLNTPLVAHAVAPAPISVTHSVELNIKPERIWGIVKDFGSLHHWHPGFTNTELTQGTNGRVGAFRVATMAHGPRMSDELLQYSEQSKSYRYRMIASSLPVDSYIGTISVRSKNKTSIVTWNVNFKRNVSSASLTDADVKLIIDHLVQVGLTNLKRIANNAA